MVTTRQQGNNRSRWRRRLRLVKSRREIALINSASWQAGVCMGKAQEEGGKKSLVAQVAARA
jgi:Xaa-Pro aminopeptidase